MTAASSSERGRYLVLSAFLLCVLSIVPLTYFALKSSEAKVRLMEAMQDEIRGLEESKCDSTAELSEINRHLDQLNQQLATVPEVFSELHADPRFAELQATAMKASLPQNDCERFPVARRALIASCKACHERFKY